MKLSQIRSKIYSKTSFSIRMSLAGYPLTFNNEFFSKSDIFSGEYITDYTTSSIRLPYVNKYRISHTFIELITSYGVNTKHCLANYNCRQKRRQKW